MAGSKPSTTSAGKDCCIGLDLSSGGDLTSIAVVVPYQLDGEKKYYIYSHSFIPEKRVQQHIDSDNVPYDMWTKSGLLTVTQTLCGVKTDYKYILSHVEKLVEEYDLQVEAICYDPANASAFLGDLEDTGYDSVEIRQSAKSLNDATVDFRLEVEAGNVEYDQKTNC